MSILLAYHKRFCENGRKLIEPDGVKLQTRRYQNSSDAYAEFISENLVEDHKSSLSIVQIYGIFRPWYKANVPDARVPSRNDVLAYFRKHLSRRQYGNTNKWRYRMSNDIDDHEAKLE